MSFQVLITIKKKQPPISDTTPSEKKTNIEIPKPEIPTPEPEPEPAPDVPKLIRDALPAPGEINIPFEDIQPELAPPDDISPPEPAKVTESKSKQDLFEIYEKDYLKRLEEQRKQEDLARQAAKEQAIQDEILKKQARQQKHKAVKSPKSTTSPHSALPATGQVDILFEKSQPKEAPADSIKPESQDTLPVDKADAPPKKAQLEKTVEPEPETRILSFVDPTKDVQYYVKRFINEPKYKEWFNRNYPEYTMYQAVGISETEFRQIVDDVTPESEPAKVTEKSSSSPHGTLPATGEIDVPFEQQQPPKATDAEITNSEGDVMDFDDDDEDKDPTPEQLARFDELEKQLEEVIQQSETIEDDTVEQLVPPDVLTKPTEAEPESPHAALPATSQVDIPFEKSQPQDIEPEPAVTKHDDDLAKQYEKISELTNQVKELETIAVASKTEPETTDKIIEKFEQTSKQQIEQLEKLEEQIGEIADVDVESILIEKLRRQMDKLNAIEKRIIDAQEPTPEQIALVKELERKIAELEEKQKVSDVIAYCVKCKQKQNMSNPESTTMKNGRGAIKGTCHVCGTNMFKIGNTNADDPPTKAQIQRIKKLEKQIADLENKQSDVTVIGYCVRCRSKQEMANPESTTMKNDKPAVRGTCSICDTKMHKIGKM